MSFCGNCGAKLDDNQAFCPNCGAKQEVASTQMNNSNDIYAQPAGAAAQPKPQSGNIVQNVGQAAQDAGKKAMNFVQDTVSDVKNKKADPVKLIIGAVAAVVAVFLVIFLFRSVIGSGAITKKGAVKAYSKADSGKEVIAATMSKRMIKATGLKKKELIDLVDERLEKIADQQKEEVEVKITKVQLKSKKKLNKSKLNKLNDNLEETYHLDKNPKIKKAYTVKAKVTGKRDGKKFNETVEYTIYKQSGNWYVLDQSILGMAYNSTLKDSSGSSSDYSYGDSSNYGGYDLNNLNGLLEQFGY